jgi:hypothetical protein
MNTGAGISKDVLDRWPNCRIPDCSNKCCLWGIDNSLCSPCNDAVYGRSATDRQYSETHRGALP